jgi:integration host factor subunit beta
MEQNNKMTKSDLIQLIADGQGHLPFKDVEDSVNSILNQIVESLETGGRVEIRGFGAFTLHHRPAKIGRNPKTGESVRVSEKYVPFFKPGKILSAKINSKINSG